MGVNKVNRKGFAIIEALVALGILAVFAAFLVGLVAARNANLDKRSTENDAPVAKRFHMSTVRYEGHKWVMNRTMDYFLHHPECPCGGKAERDE